jgi:hypothetical protein
MNDKRSFGSSRTYIKRQRGSKIYDYHNVQKKQVNVLLQLLQPTIRGSYSRNKCQMRFGLFKLILKGIKANEIDGKLKIFNFNDKRRQH